MNRITLPGEPPSIQECTLCDNNHDCWGCSKFEEIITRLWELENEISTQKHGAWLLKQEYGQLVSRICSECGYVLTQQKDEEIGKYCYHCGAIMGAKEDTNAEP